MYLQPLPLYHHFPDHHSNLECIIWLERIITLFIPPLYFIKISIYECDIIFII